VGWKVGLLLQIVAGATVTILLLAAIEFVCGYFVRAGEAAERAASLRTVEGDAVSTLLKFIDGNPAPLVRDVDLLWRNKPLVSKTQPVNPRRFGRDDTWTIETNSQGYRGPEEAFKRARTGVYRILFIGDSVTYGFNVDQDAVFARRLENRLHARFPSQRFEVINAAVPGWSWVQGLRFLETEGLALHPNLVVMAHGMNDQYWVAKITDDERLQSLEKPLARVLQHASILLERTNSYRLLTSFTSPPPSEPSTNSPACEQQIRENDVCRRVSLPEIEAEVHKVHALTAAAGVDLLILNLEFMETQAAAAAHRAIDREGIAAADFVARFKQWRQADETARAARLRLLPAQAMPRERSANGATPVPGQRVLLRVLAPEGGSEISVKGAGYTPETFQFDAVMSDDGTHGDEVANDRVFSVTIDVPPDVGIIRYKYYLGATAEFTALPPLPSSHHDRIKQYARDSVGPIEVFGQVYLMAELAHPDAEGHERIAAGIMEELERFDSFGKFVGGG